MEEAPHPAWSGFEPNLDPGLPRVLDPGRVEPLSTNDNGEFGREIAKRAGIWKTYIKQAEVADEDMLKGWNASIDTLLIFAALFSAIVTAFLIESYKLMQPDFTELTYRALVHQNTSVTPENFVVTADARLVNCLWLASLISSLLTSLIGILAKQWLVAYTSDLPLKDAARDWVCTRQFRYDALRTWRVPEFIAWLPVLLHAALLLFLAGLAVFFRSIDDATALLILIMSAAVYALYGVTTLSPLIASTAPFRSPLTPLLLRVTGLATRLGTNAAALDPWNNVSRSTSYLWKSVANAVTWLILGSPVDESRHGVLYALGDISEGDTLCASLSQSQRRDLRSILFNIDVDALSLSDRSRHFSTLLNLTEPWVWGISDAQPSLPSPVSSTDSLYEPLALNQPHPTVERPPPAPRTTFRFWYLSHLLGAVPDEQAIVVIHLILNHLGWIPQTFIRTAIKDEGLETLITDYLGLYPKSALRLARDLVSFHRSVYYPPPQRSRLKAYLNLIHAYARSSMWSGPFNSGCHILHDLLLCALPDSAVPLVPAQQDPWGVISTLSAILQSDNCDIVALTSQDGEARLILISMTNFLDLTRLLQDRPTRFKYYVCWLCVLSNPRHAQLANWSSLEVNLLADAVAIVANTPINTADDLRLSPVILAARVVASMLSLRVSYRLQPWAVFHDCVVGLLRSDIVSWEILDIILSDATLATLGHRSPTDCHCLLVIMESLARVSRVSADMPDFSMLLQRFACFSSVEDGATSEEGQWDFVAAFRAAFRLFVQGFLNTEPSGSEPPTAAKRLLSSVATLAAVDPVRTSWFAIAECIVHDLTPSALRKIQSARRSPASWLSPRDTQPIWEAVDFIPDLLFFLQVVGVSPPRWLPKSLYAPIAPSRRDTNPRPDGYQALPSSGAIIRINPPPVINDALTRWDPLIAWARRQHWQELYPSLVSHASIAPNYLRQRLDMMVRNEFFSSRDHHIVAVEHASWPLMLLPDSTHPADLQRILSPLPLIPSYLRGSVFVPAISEVDESESWAYDANSLRDADVTSGNDLASLASIYDATGDVETELDEVEHRAEVRRGKRRQEPEDAEGSSLSPRDPFPVRDALYLFSESPPGILLRLWRPDSPTLRPLYDHADSMSSLEL